MKVFVDTGAWLALAVSGDQHHKKARRILGDLSAQPLQLLTTDYVLDETLTLIRYRAGHSKALEMYRFVSQSPSVKLVFLDPEMWRSAFEIFRRYRDKEWSFTDCTSFAVMDLQNVDTAFAFDRHFTQYGKIRCLSARD